VKPQQKLSETDAIFAPVAEANRQADTDPHTLRISIDSKAKVKNGNLSRGGKTLALQALQADDHDDHWEAVLVPFGMLDINASQ
jgi:hypothetical protein